MVLRCGHQVCTDCLDTVKQQQGKASVRCEICKQETSQSKLLPSLNALDCIQKVLCDIRDKARTTNDLVSEKIAQVRAQEQSHDDVDESADKGEDKAAEKGSD